MLNLQHDTYNLISWKRQHEKADATQIFNEHYSISGIIISFRFALVLQ